MGNEGLINDQFIETSPGVFTHRSRVGSMGPQVGKPNQLDGPPSPDKVQEGIRKSVGKRPGHLLADRQPKPKRLGPYKLRRVTITAYRHNALDDHDNARQGYKYFVDAVARAMKLDDRNIDWRFAEVIIPRDQTQVTTVMVEDIESDIPD